MYDSAELFDMQEVVGAKLESILAERSYTKAKFCSEANISRPTLDKVLAGNITSMTSYAKHIDKILNCLGMTADMMLGGISHKYNKFKSLRDVLRMDENALARFAGVSVDRLKEIEAGAYAKGAELRDMAVGLKTGVKDILGENYFPIQIATLGYITSRGKMKEIAGAGFWGHVGIRPLSTDKYLWYPITGNTRDMICDMMENKKLVIPCMNDKVLLVNTKNISNIVLLDEACDAPGFANWDPGVDEGGIPMVFYESLQDYLDYVEDGDDPDPELFSSNFCAWMDDLIKEKYGGIDEAYCAQDEISIYYPGGRHDYHDMDFYCTETITSEISFIYEFGESVLEEKFLFYTDCNGATMFLNAEAFSVVELSLTAVEKKIREDDE